MSEVIEIKAGEIRQGDTTVLKNINVVIESHEFVYLIGKTGSGKSSLLKALYGELGLSSGTGFVAGFDLNKMRKRDVPNLRRSIGVVFQDFQLLTDRSVLKKFNVRHGGVGMARQEINANTGKRSFTISWAGTKNQCHAICSFWWRTTKCFNCTGPIEQHRSSFLPMSLQEIWIPKHPKK